MKKLAFVFAAAAMLFTSCSKDDDNGGGSSETINYLPLKAGNTWTYKATNNKTSTSASYTLTATGTTETHNGKTYTVLTSSAGSSAKELYNVTGKSYTQYGALSDLGANIELNYLAGNNNKGDKWSQTGLSATVSGFAATFSINYEITDKLATTTVNGKTYTDVAVVKLTIADLKISGATVGITSQNIEMQIAKNVGKIKQKLNVVIGLPVPDATINTELELTNSNITL